MRSLTSSIAILGIISLGAINGMAAQDRLEGKWEGTMSSMQGEVAATVTFKKAGDGYSGAVSKPRGEGDLPLADLKVQGDTITAHATVDSPQGALDVKYTFVLHGDVLTGKGLVEFGGQTFELTYNLKRGATGGPVSQAPSAGAGAPGQAAGPRPGRGGVPQPQQKQALNYFAGTWTIKWTERESPLGAGGPSEATITFTPTADGKFLMGQSQGNGGSGSFRGKTIIGYDEDAHLLTFLEDRGAGAQMLSIGDWRSPISVRFTISPVTIGGQVLTLKRTISVVSAFSFTVTEELSVDGGPFQRLGQGLFAKK